MMNDLNTYLLMTELCKRLSDHLYDPEPTHDHVFTYLKDEGYPLQDLYDALRMNINVYKGGMEKRIADEDV